MENAATHNQLLTNMLLFSSSRFKVKAREKPLACDGCARLELIELMSRYVSDMCKQHSFQSFHRLPLHNTVKIPRKEKIVCLADVTFCKTFTCDGKYQQLGYKMLMQDVAHFVQQSKCDTPPRLDSTTLDFFYSHIMLGHSVAEDETQAGSGYRKETQNLTFVNGTSAADFFWRSQCNDETLEVADVRERCPNMPYLDCVSLWRMSAKDARHMSRVLVCDRSIVELYIKWKRNEIDDAQYESRKERLMKCGYTLEGTDEYATDCMTRNIFAPVSKEEIGSQYTQACDMIADRYERALQMMRDWRSLVNEQCLQKFVTSISHKYTNRRRLLRTASGAAELKAYLRRVNCAFDKLEVDAQRVDALPCLTQDTRKIEDDIAAEIESQLAHKDRVRKHVYHGRERSASSEGDDPLEMEKIDVERCKRAAEELHTDTSYEEVSEENMTFEEDLNEYDEDTCFAVCNETLEENMQSFDDDWMLSKDELKRKKNREELAQNRDTFMLRKLPTMLRRRIEKRRCCTAHLENEEMRLLDGLRKLCIMLDVVHTEIVVCAAESHQMLIDVAPYPIGNGALARLVVNLFLSVAHLPPFLVEPGTLLERAYASYVGFSLQHNSALTLSSLFLRQLQYLSHSNEFVRMPQTLRYVKHAYGAKFCVRSAMQEAHKAWLHCESKRYVDLDVSKSSYGIPSQLMKERMLRVCFGINMYRVVCRASCALLFVHKDKKALHPAHWYNAHHLQ